MSCAVGAGMMAAETLEEDPSQPTMCENPQEKGYEKRTHWVG